MVKMERLVEIGLIYYPDCLISAIYGLTDMFRIANMAASRAEGLQRPLIRTSHWKQNEKGVLECIFDSHPGTPNNPAFVVLPPSMIEPVPEQATQPIADWIRTLHKKGTTICATCAGTFVLAHAGILKGRSVTTHWLFNEHLQAAYPDIKIDTKKMIIDDGDIITAGGMMAWTDLGLLLIHRIMGPSLMLESARILLIDPSGREQSFYNVFTPKLLHGDETILKVQHWLQSKSSGNAAIADMAGIAGMEERTFLRHFQKATGMRPTEYVQNIKVSRAREMLEFTHQSVDQIAWSVGYEDPGAFRKIFQKMMGLSPSAYRERFSVSA